MKGWNTIGEFSRKIGVSTKALRLIIGFRGNDRAHLRSSLPPVGAIAKKLSMIGTTRHLLRSRPEGDFFIVFFPSDIDLRIFPASARRRHKASFVRLIDEPCERAISCAMLNAEFGSRITSSFELSTQPIRAPRGFRHPLNES